MSFLWLCLWTGLFILISDLTTKQWVQSNLPVMSSRFPEYPYGGIPVFENFFGIEFSITHLTNKGAAWGALGGYQDYLLIARVILICALVVYFWKLAKLPMMQFFLSLVIAGALGNVIDYFIYGHVIDMFHFVLWGYDFPVFNVADSAVCIGICGLIILSAWKESNNLKVKG